MAIKAIDFGILPHLSNLPAFSYSLWMKRSAPAGGVLIGKSVDTGSGRRGHYIVLSNRTLIFISHKTPNDGTWEATNALPDDFNWHNIILRYDNTSDKADPLIDVGGTPATVTETGAPSGVTDDDSDCPLVLFNIGPDPATEDQYYYDGVHDYAMKDIRAYGIILSASDVSTIAAGEDDYSTVPTGRLFHGIFAPTANIDDYIGDSLENDDLVLEIVYGAGGVPYSDTEIDTLTGDSI